MGSWRCGGADYRSTAGDEGRLGRREGRIALSGREQLECMFLYQPADNVWVRIRKQISMGDTVVGSYYRSPDQEEEVDKAFFGQLKKPQIHML